jgi:hypothetical protein
MMNGLRKWGTNTQWSIIFSHKKNEMSFVDKLMELEIMLVKYVRFRKTKVTCFLSYVEDRPK